MQRVGAIWCHSEHHPVENQSRNQPRPRTPMFLLCRSITPAYLRRVQRRPQWNRRLCNWNPGHCIPCAACSSLRVALSMGIGHHSTRPRPAALAAPAGVRNPALNLDDETQASHRKYQCLGFFGIAGDNGFSSCFTTVTVSILTTRL